MRTEWIHVFIEENWEEPIDGGLVMVILFSPREMWPVDTGMGEVTTEYPLA